MDDHVVAISGVHERIAEVQGRSVKLARKLRRVSGPEVRQELAELLNILVGDFTCALEFVQG
jgi:hypothetical protein